MNEFYYEEHPSLHYPPAVCDECGEVLDDCRCVSQEAECNEL